MAPNIDDSHKWSLRWCDVSFEIFSLSKINVRYSFYREFNVL